MKRRASRLSCTAVRLLCLLLVSAAFPSTRADEPKAALQNSQNILEGWLATAATEPPVEAVPVSRGMSPEMQGIIRQTNLLQGNSGTFGGVAGLASDLMLWTAELANESAGKGRDARNFQFLLALREQVPVDSDGIDVVVLGDKETGYAIVCFTAEYYDSHRDEIRKRFPEDKFEFMQSDSPWLNFEHLAPVGETTPLAREAFRRMAGPIIDSEADLKEHFRSYWAPDPASLPPTPPLNPDDLNYSREQLEKDLIQMKSLARAILAYENKRKKRSNRPGGIVLGGGLKFPAGLSPTALYLYGKKLYLRGGGQDLEIEGVDPAEFSILLRSTVLTEQPPALSIGSEPSERPGYQRVTYFSSIRNSSVGAGMLQADLKLKGLLAGIGMGPGGTPSGPSQNFLSSFPPTDAVRWIRLWLVSNEIVLENRADRLAPANPAMALNYEMILRERPVKDSEIDRFIADFNRKWPELASEIPDFRHLEKLALTSALARWARDVKIVIAPELWLLPFNYVPTPDYVPAVWTVNRAGLTSVSGGVYLFGAKELVQPRLGLMLPLTLQSVLFETSDTDSTVAWIALGASLFFVVLLVLLVGRLLNRGSGLAWHQSFLHSGPIVLATLVAVTTLHLLAAELLDADLLPAFDSEFLSLLAMMVLTPLLLRHFLSRDKNLFRRNQATVRVGLGELVSLSLMVTLVLALMSSSLILLLVSSGAESSIGVGALNRVAAPVEILGRPWASRSTESIGLQFIPQSLVRATRGRFYLPNAEARIDLGPRFMLDGSLQTNWAPEELEIPLLDDKSGPSGSIVRVSRIDSTGFVSRQSAYSVSGKPPY